MGSGIQVYSAVCKAVVAGKIMTHDALCHLDKADSTRIGKAKLTPYTEN
jgi:hypothetical protein